MSVREAVSIITDMYGRGGVIICTGKDLSRVNADVPKSRIYAKTLIQPDGDIVNMLSEDCLHIPDLWSGHAENIKQKLSPLKKLAAILKSAPLLAVPVSLLTTRALWIAISEGNLKMMISGIICMIITVVFCLFRKLAGFAIRWWIMKEVHKPNEI